MVLRTSNFIPRGDGLYEIWITDERDNFFRVRKDGRGFLGTLGEANEFIYEAKREWLEAHPDAERHSDVTATGFALDGVIGGKEIP